MVPDESQNLDESALGQSRCCNERGLDESRKQDKRAPDESLNPDKADGECRPRAIHHRYRDAARTLAQTQGRVLPSRWMLEESEFIQKDGSIASTQALDFRANRPARLESVRNGRPRRQFMRERTLSQSDRRPLPPVSANRSGNLRASDRIGVRSPHAGPGRATDRNAAFPGGRCRSPSLPLHRIVLARPQHPRARESPPQ
jgi:hypothetical protein